MTYLSEGMWNLVLQSLKTYQHHNAYGYQNWQASNSPWGIPLPINSHNPLNMCSRGVTCQIKNFDLHYHNAYGHKTYQYGDIEQGAPTSKFTWPRNEIFVWGHVAN